MVTRIQKQYLSAAVIALIMGASAQSMNSKAKLEELKKNSSHKEEFFQAAKVCATDFSTLVNTLKPQPLRAEAERLYKRDFSMRKTNRKKIKASFKDENKSKKSKPLTPEEVAIETLVAQIQQQEIEQPKEQVSQGWLGWAKKKASNVVNNSKREFNKLSKQVSSRYIFKNNGLSLADHLTFVGVWSLCAVTLYLKMQTLGQETLQ